MPIIARFKQELERQVTLIINTIDEENLYDLAENLQELVHRHTTTITEEMYKSRNNDLVKESPVLGAIFGIHIHDTKNSIIKPANQLLARIYGYRQGQNIQAPDLSVLDEIDVKISLDKLKKSKMALNGLSGDVSQIANVLKFSNITFNKPKQLVIATCQADVMRDILKELISNAVSAIGENPQGKVDVHIKNGKQPVIEIIDNGKGVSSEDLERIFNPGFTSKGDQGGTGLGLYFAKEYIESLGGTITVTSSQDDEDHGAKFTIKLPLAKR